MIKAITPSGREVYIVQFVLATSGYIFAVTVDENGNISDIPATQLTVIEKGYREQSEGKWIYNPDGIDWGLGSWQCSLCGCNNHNLPRDNGTNPLVWAGSKFCPNCGAKMKGGK